MSKLKTKNTIITVDDFGYNHRANQLIFEAIEKKVLNSASTMVNMPGTDEALLFIKHTLSFREKRAIAWRIQKSKVKSQNDNEKFQIVKFGLHLNLTEGKPLSKPEDVTSLIDENGQLLGWQGFIKRALVGQLRSQDIEQETRAQIEKIQTVIKPVPSLNSHHHIHMWPQIAKIVLPLCHEYGIKHVRWPRRIWWRSLATKHGLKALLIQSLSAWQPSHHHLAMAKYFFDLDWLEQPIKNIDGILARLPANTEVGCHPLSTSHGVQPSLISIIEHNS